MIVSNIRKKTILKILTVGVLLVGLFRTELLFAAADPKAIGGIATNIIANFRELAKLITAGAYIAGMGFAVGAVLKFKAHKDNPTQIPVGTPIALIFIAAALIFMPTIFETAGHTLFSGNGSAGGVSGTASIPS